jgi:hypothetical protein
MWPMSLTRSLHKNLKNNTQVLPLETLRVAGFLLTEYSQFAIIWTYCNNKEPVMKALNALIKQENAWASMFNGRFVAYEVATVAGRKRVAEMIDCKLSPENLSCDGELPRSQVQARYRALTGAAQDLVKLDPSMAQFMYEFGE